MIIYIEHQAKDYDRTQEILKKYKNASVIWVDNYKNIFDKNTGNYKTEKSIIIAKLKSNPITEAPVGYGYPGKAYFFKTSLNCIFDCSYCYLKGAFKSEDMVFFVNYEDIKKSIKKTIQQERDLGYTGDIWFYSSDYSDILGMDGISGFTEEFIKFFEQFQNVKMEMRTKSGNVKPLLQLGFIPKNTEVAFSLNPQSLINEYETGTSSLEKRYEAINTLLEYGFITGLRFLPLLPVQNYQEIYGQFIKELKGKIDMDSIYSTFASGLLYTKKDYTTILKKYPRLDILHMLELGDDEFYREAREVRETFYKMFKALDNKCMLCLEN